MRLRHRITVLRFTESRSAMATLDSPSAAARTIRHRILAAQQLHPERVQYYLEKRDPEFASKMKDILLVYQEVALQNERQADGATPRVITVSVDEKPGLQALANTAPDLLPVAGKHPTVGRDHAYQRLGTCSLLAAVCNLSASGT
jgi:hypothetical protein